MTSTSPLKNIPFNNINLAGLQKKYGMPKQVKAHGRFFPDKIADTGRDPKGGYSDFIKNDILKPLNRNLEDLPISFKPYQKYELSKINSSDNLNLDNNKWSLNTSKKFTSPEKIPKMQQYKDYIFPNLTKDPEKVEKYKNTYLKSDNISIRYPNLDDSKFKNINVFNDNQIKTELVNTNNYGERKNTIRNSHTDINNDLISTDIIENKNPKFELVKNFKGKTKIIKNNSFKLFFTKESLEKYKLLVCLLIIL